MRKLLRDELKSAECRIRDLRSDLLEKRDLSVAAIREQVHIQDYISVLELLSKEFEENTQIINSIEIKWQDNRKRYQKLPKDYFSNNDISKLNALSKRLAKNAQCFGYSSTDITRLQISRDNYRPISEGFEVAFDASASDNVRLIWAYTLALFQVSLEQGGSHWGILVFDEPEQQKIQDASSESLYKEVSCIPANEFQMIIATSASKEVTIGRVNNIRHKLLEFGDKVIRPT
jgi:hypothetical protein